MRYHKNQHGIVEGHPIDENLTQDEEKERFERVLDNIKTEIGALVENGTLKYSDIRELHL
jgi:hypothetical protein